MSSAAVLELRPAAEVDQVAVAALAARRGESAPRAPQIVALVDGRIAAVISLRDGALVSEPHAAGETTELLRARAEQLEPPRRGRRRLRRRRRLVAPCG